MKLRKGLFGSLLMVFLFGLNSSQASAACSIYASNGERADVTADILSEVLQKTKACPENVQAFKATLKEMGFDAKPFMVANRGIHNPVLGSFSFFESVSSGDLFFGHFTEAVNGEIVADQKPTQGKLMIELIAWDARKGFYNFYELIGTGSGSEWYYRGDSNDILSDNSRVYLNAGQPKFGSRLRCSACHVSGGPIMKELAAPHNDWWSNSRPLKFSPNKPSPEVAAWVQNLGDSSELSHLVKKGISQLEASPKYQRLKTQSGYQHLLRPLFCETEINLESDTLPLQRVSKLIKIPTASIINPFLYQGVLTIDIESYNRLLKQFSLSFPETPYQDADHAWLVPVKGYSDLAAIQNLIDKGQVSDEFVADVLSIDFENPLFSKDRCELLKLVPNDGLHEFPQRLKLSNLPAAEVLYENLTNPTRNRRYHSDLARKHVLQVQKELQSIEGQKKIFTNLIKTRESVYHSDISKNPRGQILEPGFRVIFPVPR